MSICATHSLCSCVCCVHSVYQHTSWVCVVCSLSFMHKAIVLLIIGQAFGNDLTLEDDVTIENETCSVTFLGIGDLVEEIPEKFKECVSLTNVGWPDKYSRCRGRVYDLVTEQKQLFVCRHHEHIFARLTIGYGKTFLFFNKVYNDLAIRGICKNIWKRRDALLEPLVRSRWLQLADVNIAEIEKYFPKAVKNLSALAVHGCYPASHPQLFPTERKECLLCKEVIFKLQKRINVGVLSPQKMRYYDDQMSRFTTAYSLNYLDDGALRRMLAEDVPKSFHELFVNWMNPRSALDQFNANVPAMSIKFADSELGRKWVAFSNILIQRNVEEELRNCVSVENVIGIEYASVVALFACDISLGDDQQASIEYILSHYPRTIKDLYLLLTSRACINHVYGITERSNYVGVCDLGRVLLPRLATIIDDTNNIDYRLSSALTSRYFSYYYSEKLPGQDLFRFDQNSIESFIRTNNPFVKLHDLDYTSGTFDSLLESPVAPLVLAHYLGHN